MNLAAIHLRMQQASAIARLPLARGRWSGTAGIVAGRGTGSSIDFQDQRQYVPGDDPRHINWLASARTGTHTMKLYREEVSPRVDLVVDASRSMFVDDAKAQRSWETIYFCLESALRQGGTVRILLLALRAGEPPREHPVAAALAHDWPATAATTAPERLLEQMPRLPLRPGSLRVLVSDLLDASPPAAVAVHLAASGGRALVVAPACRAERDPDWPDAVEFEDCESGTLRRQAVDDAIRTRYSEAYRRHFALWHEAALRRGIGLARIDAEGDFLTAVRGEPLARGVIELV
ncbi:MAG: DUF58 domain-containing protein [Planctomycetaceae bacterium]